MGYFTVDMCKEQLEKWLKASEMIANAQEYAIDGRNLTRANLEEVMNMIDFWEKKYNKAKQESETEGSSGFVTMVPRG